jgi:hypothetical protein
MVEGDRHADGAQDVQRAVRRPVDLGQVKWPTTAVTMYARSFHRDNNRSIEAQLADGRQDHRLTLWIAGDKSLSRLGSRENALLYAASFSDATF